MIWERYKASSKSPTTIPDLHAWVQAKSDLTPETIRNTQQFEIQEIKQIERVCVEVNPDQSSVNSQCESVAMTTPCCVDVCRSLSWSLWCSFIYWQPIETYLDVAYEAPFVISNPDCGFSFRNAKIASFHPSFNSGYKIGGALFYSDKNSVSTEYTSLNAKNTIHKTMSPTGFLFSRWISTVLISNTAATKLFANWSLNFKVVNLEMNHKMQFQHHFNLTPHAGLATAFIDQKFHGIFSLIIPTPTVINTRASSDSWGIGPRFGIHGQWILCSGLYLSGEIASEILFTNYNLKLKQNASNNSLIFMDAQNKIHEIRPELDMFLGAGYETVRYSIEAGYEFQIWWYQNMLRWYSDYTYLSIPQGNLSFHGLRATFNVNF